MSGDRAFAQESARYLAEVYLPRLREALTTLTADDLWWRPHDGCLAFGTVLLHLDNELGVSLGPFWRTDSICFREKRT